MNKPPRHLPPPTRFGGAQPGLQAKTVALAKVSPRVHALPPFSAPSPSVVAQRAAPPASCSRVHAPPPTRYALVGTGRALQAFRGFVGAVGGLVIQAAWVYIGSAATKTNMTDLGSGRFQHTATGKTYRTVGTLGGCPMVTEEAAGGGGDSDDDDALSQYSQHSIADLPGTFAGFGGRSAVVLDTYSGLRHAMVEPINTSKGLSEAVLSFDTAKNAAANTHVLYRGPTDAKYSVTSIGTATAVRLYMKRSGFETLVPNVQSVWGKGAHVHAEMHLIHSRTGGNAAAIDGCLAGHILVVDKEVCADCYPYVVRANPAEVRDGSDFASKGASQRQSWPDWNNPFT